jgi:uncharacterized protein (TIGR03084 family)
MDDICRDLTDEHDALDAIVAPLAPEQWDLPTPAPGWAVRDEISHLWFFDERAVMAATDPDTFATDQRRLLSGGGTDASVEPGRALDPVDLLANWRRDRVAMVDVLRSLDPKARIVWYGPPMSAVSFATARLMETWAHGQDIVDAVGATRPATDRLRHVAFIGVRARPFSYATNGKAMPEGDVRVELDAPGGGTWVYGDGAATDIVRGPALDFCLVVTQRCHPADTALVVEGPLAEEWMGIAQAFAGPPGAGRAAGQFTAN